jgi:nucleolin
MEKDFNDDTNQKQETTEKFTVFVGNLGFKTSENTIKTFFDECGNVIAVRIAKDRETGRSRGFCHVDFDAQEAVEKAKAKSGQQLDGRDVRVDESLPKESGFRKIFFNFRWWKRWKRKLR